jgi:hypothetical protein
MGPESHKKDQFKQPKSNPDVKRTEVSGGCSVICVSVLVIHSYPGKGLNHYVTDVCKPEEGPSNHTTQSAQKGSAFAEGVHRYLVVVTFSDKTFCVFLFIIVKREFVLIHIYY